jgi:4-hydroxybenzoate polyprenyltransferase
MRLANIVTAISDILAGIAIAFYVGNIEWSSAEFRPIIFLIIATIGLYGGGVVLNDVFDAELDKTERPERPIPSGLISQFEAAVFGSLLLLTGIVSSAMVHAGELLSESTLVAIAIAVAAVVYDKWGKHHPFLGPLNMGVCRGLNLLLGMSILPQTLGQYGYACLVPVLYIAAITMISRGEVHGGKKTTLYGAVALYIIVISSIGVIAFFNGTLLYALGFLLLFAVLIFPPLQIAINEPKGPLIGKAVKAGVIALIAMNAAWAAAFGAIYFALLILLLLPFSLWLAKLFAVT